MSHTYAIYLRNEGDNGYLCEIEADSPEDALQKYCEEYGISNDSNIQAVPGVRIYGITNQR